MLKTWLPSEPVWLNQVHGSNIVDAGKVGGIPDADASFTFQKDTVCVVMTADCLPVLLCTADGTAVAAVHARMARTVCRGAGEGGWHARGKRRFRHNGVAGAGYRAGGL